MTAPMYCRLKSLPAWTGLAYKTWKKIVQTGTIPAFKVGRAVVVRRDDVEEYLTRQPRSPR